MNEKEFHISADQRGEALLYVNGQHFAIYGLNRRGKPYVERFRVGDLSDQALRLSVSILWETCPEHDLVREYAELFLFLVIGTLPPGKWTFTTADVRRWLEGQGCELVNPGIETNGGPPPM